MKEYEDGDIISDTHWRAMKRAINGNAIITGLTPSITGTLEITISTGIYYANNTRRVITIAVPLTIDTTGADPRIDIITANDSGTVQVKKGTASPHPLPQNLSDNEILIAEIDLPANTTAILTDMVRLFGFQNITREHGYTHHELGMIDEIDVTDLSGELADFQKTTWAKVDSIPYEFTPATHSWETKHTNSGTNNYWMLSNGIGGTTWDNRPTTLPITKYTQNIVMAQNSIPQSTWTSLIFPNGGFISSGTIITNNTGSNGYFDLFLYVRHMGKYPGYYPYSDYFSLRVRFNGTTTYKYDFTGRTVVDDPFTDSDFMGFQFIVYLPASQYIEIQVTSNPFGPTDWLLSGWLIIKKVG